MKQLTASLAALVLGVGIGIGIGMTISKSKISERQMVIDDLKAENETIEASKAESEEIIQKTLEMTAGLNKTLSSYKAINEQLKAELTRTRAELAQLKKRNIQPVVTNPDVVTEAKTVINPAVAVPPATPSTEYIVKDGDNLWKIAEQQLGNGMRYKEILLLNPNISEEQTLVVGTKLKLPSQKN